MIIAKEKTTNALKNIRNIVEARNMNWKDHLQLQQDIRTLELLVKEYERLSAGEPCTKEEYEAQKPLEAPSTQ